MSVDGDSVVLVSVDGDGVVLVMSMVMVIFIIYSFIPTEFGRNPLNSFGATLATNKQTFYKQTDRNEDRLPTG